MAKIVFPILEKTSQLLVYKIKQGIESRLSDLFHHFKAKSQHTSTRNVIGTIPHPAHKLIGIGTIKIFTIQYQYFLNATHNIPL